MCESFNTNSISQNLSEQSKSQAINGNGNVQTMLIAHNNIIIKHDSYPSQISTDEEWRLIYEAPFRENTKEPADFQIALYENQTNTSIIRINLTISFRSVQRKITIPSPRKSKQYQSSSPLPQFFHRIFIHKKETQLTVDDLNVDVRFGLKYSELFLELTNAKMQEKLNDVRHEDFKVNPKFSSTAPEWEFKLKDSQIILVGYMENKILGKISLNSDNSNNFQIQAYLQTYINRNCINIEEFDCGLDPDINEIKNGTMRQTIMGVLLKDLKEELANTNDEKYTIHNRYPIN